MEQDQQKPTLKLITDDHMSMTSDLIVTVDRSLGRVIFKHETQFGPPYPEFQVFAADLTVLSGFLAETAAWIASGYKEKLKPDSSDYT